MRIFGKEHDLQRIWDRCRRSDSEAWGQLVDRFQAMVYGIAYRHGLREEDAGDLFQAVFGALLRHRDSIEHGGALPKWIALTASREAQRLNRNRARTVSVEGEDALDALMERQEATAESDAVEGVRSQVLRDSVEKLGGRCRDLLTRLYLTEEASYAEISEEIGIPVGAIGPTRARCLDKLRKSLEADGFFAEDLY